MADPQFNLIERFPEYVKAIRQLAGSNSAFNTMTHEFNQVCDELGRVEPQDAVDLDTENLRRRRKALQEEMLMLMRQTARL